MQIIAAIGGVINDIFADWFGAHEQQDIPGNLESLADELKAMRLLFLDAVKFVTENTDKQFWLDADHEEDIWGNLSRQYP